MVLLEQATVRKCELGPRRWQARWQRRSRSSCCTQRTGTGLACARGCRRARPRFLDPRFAAALGARHLLGVELLVDAVRGRPRLPVLLGAVRAEPTEVIELPHTLRVARPPLRQRCPGCPVLRARCNNPGGTDGGGTDGGSTAAGQHAVNLIHGHVNLVEILFVLGAELWQLHWRAHVRRHAFDVACAKVQAVVRVAERERRVRLVLHAADGTHREALELAVEAVPVTFGQCVFSERRVMALEVVAIVAAVAEDEFAFPRTLGLLALFADRVRVALLRGRAESLLGWHCHLSARGAHAVSERHKVRVARRDLPNTALLERLELGGLSRVLNDRAVARAQTDGTGGAHRPPHVHLALVAHGGRVALARGDRAHAHAMGRADPDDDRGRRLVRRAGPAKLEHGALLEQQQRVLKAGGYLPDRAQMVGRLDPRWLVLVADVGRT